MNRVAYGRDMKINCHGVRGSRPVSIGKREFSRIVSNHMVTNSENQVDQKFLSLINSLSSDDASVEHIFGLNKDLQNFVVKKLESINKSALGFVSNTPCVEIKDESLPSTEKLIFDLGTGVSEIDIPPNIDTLHIFFTHFHYDHVQGMMFFNALYNSNINVHFYSYVEGFDKYLNELMLHPYFPVTMSEAMPSKIHFHELHQKKNIKIGNMTITWMEINHPGGCVAYKICNDKKTFCYFTDVNINDDLFKKTKENIEFLNDIDTMILDSSMSFEDSVRKRYFGHSNFYLGVDFATFWKVKKILLFHFDPADDITILPILYQSAQWYKSVLNSKIEIDLAQEDKWLQV